MNRNCRKPGKIFRKPADEALQKKDFNRLDYLSLAYLMTDNKEYADVIKEILSKAVEAESWGRYGNDGTYSCLAFATRHGT